MKRSRASGRIGAALALGFTLAVISLPALGQSPGVVINKEGSSVFVTIDPSVVPNLGNRERKDGQMIFEVPDTSVLQVDPNVKNLVRVEGRKVIINSDQVYLGTQDLSKNAAAPSVPAQPAASTPAPAKPAAIQLQPAPVADKAPPKPRQDATPPPAPARSAKAEPSTSTTNTATPAKAQPAPVASRPTTPATPAGTPARPVVQAPVQTPQTDTKATPAPTAPMIEEAALSEAGTQFGLLVSQPIESQAEVLLPASAPVAESNELALSDPEALPLDYLDVQREETARSSMQLLLRLALSLGLVLLLAVGFTKSLLPRLMATYPEFFNRLQRKDALASPMEREMERPQNRIVAQPKAPARKDSSKKQYLEQLKVNGNQFNVLTSQNLGKGKELHLVEIKGRQLVIATTPFTISLIKDLGDPAQPETDSDAEAGTVEEPQVSGLLGTGQGQFDTAFERATRAYMEQPAPEPPVVEGQTTARYSRIVNKRFASGPGQAQADETEKSIYKKYLDPEPAPVSARERTEASPRHQEVSDLMAHERYNSPYVDAEEVVILEDYDDLYQS